MKTYYLSLCKGLAGYYVKFEAVSGAVVRNYAVRYFGGIWCGVYTEAYFMEVIRKQHPRNSRVVNRDRPIVLTQESGEYE